MVIVIIITHKKQKKTRIENGTQLNDNLSKYYKYYKKLLINRTNTIYRNNKHIINSHELLRGHKTYHLDHKYSIKQGFINNLPIEIMSHPCNLQMVYYKDNLIKQDNCSITINQLLNNIIMFDENIIFTNNELKTKYSNVKNISQTLLEKLNKKYDYK